MYQRDSPYKYYCRVLHPNQSGLACTSTAAPAGVCTHTYIYTHPGPCVSSPVWLGTSHRPPSACQPHHAERQPIQILLQSAAPPPVWPGLHLRRGARRCTHQDIIATLVLLGDYINFGTRTPPPILTDWHPSADLGDSGDSRGTPGGSRGTLGGLPSASDHLRARPSLRRKRENSDMAYLRTAPSCLALCLALSLLSDA